MFVRLHKLILLLPVMLVAVGCVTTANVNPNYRPAVGSKSPLENIRPISVVIQVEDQRPASERDRVGDRKGGFGNVLASVKSERSPTIIIQDALSAEFTNNGHRVVDDKSDYVDRSVQVALKKCWTENHANFFDVTLLGTIVSEVKIIDPSTNAVLIVKPVTGISTESRQLMLETAYEEALTKALAEFVRSFSRDPAILAALKTASASP